MNRVPHGSGLVQLAEHVKPVGSRWPCLVRAKQNLPYSRALAHYIIMTQGHSQHTRVHRVPRDTEQ